MYSKNAFSFIRNCKTTFTEKFRTLPDRGRESEVTKTPELEIGDEGKSIEDHCATQSFIWRSMEAIMSEISAFVQDSWN